MVPPGGRKPVVTDDSVRLDELRRGHICLTRDTPGDTVVPDPVGGPRSLSASAFHLRGPDVRWLVVAVQKEPGPGRWARPPSARPRRREPAGSTRDHATAHPTSRGTGGAINVSHHPVVEFDAEPMPVERVDISDAEHPANATPAARSEPAARAPGPAPSCRPVRRRAAPPTHEQVGVHEAARTVENPSAEARPGRHPDHDPVERSQAGRRAIVRTTRQIGNQPAEPSSGSADIAESVDRSSDTPA